ncbi:hypothetical protein [Paraliomyxa miuraensis]|uniref:hypothetical protein n=1 Tax=Paraliomyxa miuraensis TaxID=376150 RepID=UPI002258D939|nr:hypothetical protein [Paraliomyxa miuraensis]MCX4243406.1 hypothetical protein [Paraliomyxa miuraensis]
MRSRTTATTLAWLVAASLGASSAHAAATPEPAARVIVRNEGCEGLVQDEVGRLLDIELAMVTSEIRSGPPLEVALRCEAEQLTIAVVDPLTHKRLERDIPAPEPEPGRERVVALAISQLFAASWLELLSATEPPPPPPDVTKPPPDRAAVDAARRVAERSTEVERLPPRPSIELLAGVGARGRALEGDGRFAAGRTELLVRGWPDPGVGWAALLGWDVGQSSRSQGLVRGHALTLGGGMAWITARRRSGVGGHVLLAGGVARIRGISREPGIPATSSTGLTAEASTGLGPRIRYGRLRIDLDAEIGAMLRAPVGTVNEGTEPPMSMGGLWAGLVLRLGGALR